MEHRELMCGVVPESDKLLLRTPLPKAIKLRLKLPSKPLPPPGEGWEGGIKIRFFQIIKDAAIP